MYFFRFLSLSMVILLTSCALSKKSQQSVFPALKFIGSYEVPHKMNFKGTQVGGLSGIDYDATSNLYYLICDDRSDINPARFYTASIELTETGIQSLNFKDVFYLKQPNDSLFPNIKQDSFHVPDPESIRYDAKNQTIIWSSEGERVTGKGKTILEDPAIYITHLNGRVKDSFELPANLHVSAEEKGPRRNGVFEGLSFTNNYKNLWVSVEEPLYEDGPRAGINDSSAWVRLIQYDAGSKKPLLQYGYRIDPVAYAPNPPSAFKVNGIPEILVYDNNHLLILERSFATGKKDCTIKVYFADLTHATDVMHLNSLLHTEQFVPIRKQLLANFETLGIYIDNVEGMTFGPVLPNGHKTLLFISDDNFSKDEKTQLLLFEIQ
ncbi:MAG TPA: esterase-like activity of phytase family protein [Flavisolibacter sp.]|jgi:hypothetical protein|nr:esterase-like activity of phytase family protein [Flavisolibacter sp.]